MRAVGAHVRSVHAHARAHRATSPLTRRACAAVPRACTPRQVRGRAEHHFTRVPAREVIAQQAADTNAEPMPLLPRRTTVALPADESQLLPAARALVARGLEVDHVDEGAPGAEEDFELLARIGAPAGNGGAPAAADGRAKREPAAADHAADPQAGAKRPRV